MTFKVGQKVVYPNHGVSLVEKIEPGHIDGVEQLYFHLRLLANNSKVMVPKTNLELVGLRPLCATREVRALFDILDGNVARRTGQTTVFGAFYVALLGFVIRLGAAAPGLPPADQVCAPAPVAGGGPPVPAPVGAVGLEQPPAAAAAVAAVDRDAGPAREQPHLVLVPKSICHGRRPCAPSGAPRSRSPAIGF